MPAKFQIWVFAKVANGANLVQANPAPHERGKRGRGKSVGKLYTSQPGKGSDGAEARNLNISAPKVGAKNLLEEILDPSDPEGAGEGAGVKGDACGRRQLLQQTLGGGSYCSRQPICAWAHRTPNIVMLCLARKS